MNKVMSVLTNKWFRLVVSLLGVISCVMLIYFDYIVFFYDIEYSDKKVFAVAASGFCVLMCLLDLYTRRSPITCIIAMVNMLAFFPLVLLDWGNWPLLLPAAVMTIFGFFCCHMNETAKTIFGTIFLLLYIIGGIAFFLVMNVFRPNTVDTLIEVGSSPSGAFRYYVLDVQNKSSGKKCVYIQPNTLDRDNGFIKLDTTIKKLVRQQQNPVKFDCEWAGTKMIINGEIYFDETEYLAKKNGVLVYDIADRGWSYTFFNIDYPIFTIIEEVKGLMGEIGDKLSDSKAETTESSDTAEDSEAAGDAEEPDTTEDSGAAEDSSSSGET